nr:hypothetical protein [Tanacetum cinerariifolium]
MIELGIASVASFVSGVSGISSRRAIAIGKYIKEKKGPRFIGRSHLKGKKEKKNSRSNYFVDSIMIRQVDQLEQFHQQDGDDKSLSDVLKGVDTIITILQRFNSRANYTETGLQELRQNNTTSNSINHGALTTVTFEEKLLAFGDGLRLICRLDDMLIACKSKAEIRSTKSLLKKEFDMKELRVEKRYLVWRSSGSESQDSEGVAIQVTYANAVGSLMYLMVCTRPDIAYAVCVVSRYLANLDRGNHVDVTGLVYSDYAKDPDKGKSITRYVFLIQGCVVRWKAMLQHVVVISTTEVEYMTHTEAV